MDGPQYRPREPVPPLNYRSTFTNNLFGSEPK